MSDLPVLRVVSLGAGVQSSALLLMAAEGEIEPRPDAAVFADTGWEPKAVYEWLDNVLVPRAAAVGIPLYRVAQGDLRADALDEEKHKFASMPLYVDSPSGGGNAMLRRQCTREYKIAPIKRQVRELLYERTGKRGGFKPGTVELWLGISKDEEVRVAPSRVGYIANRFPLVEAGLSRGDCRTWLEDRGLDGAPKSACIGCPFRTAGGWRRVKAEPEEWADAVDFDRALRDGRSRASERVGAPVFLHSSLKPLGEVDLRTTREQRVDAGQGVLSLGDEFEDDGSCESAGYCFI